MKTRAWICIPLRYPRSTLGVFAALAVLWLPALFHLHLETDGRKLFARDHAALVFQREVDDTYANSGFLVIGVESAGGASVFAPAPLNAILALTQRVAALDGVKGEEVRSLATEFSPEWSGGTLHLAPPLPVAVRTAEDAAAVRVAAVREPSMRGVLVSKDGRDTAMYVPLDPDADRADLYFRITGLVDEVWRQDADGLREYRAHVLGPAATESMLGDHVLSDLARLLPIALAATAAILWVWFRQPSIVLVALGEGVVVVLWTLGVMSLLGKPVSLVTVVLPVILSTYCVADTIHIAQYFSAQCRRAGIGSRQRAMEKTLDEVVVPLTLTSLTTATGFLSFVFSPIPPLRDFGLFSALGVLFALGVSVLIVPAALVSTRFGRTEIHFAAHPRVSRALESVGAGAVGAPRFVAMLVAAVTIVLGAGAFRLQIRDSWVQNFGASSPIVRADAWFNRSFFGSNVINVVVTPPGSSVHDPAFLREVARLQDRLGSMAAVGGSLSLIDPLRAVSRVLEGTPRLPGSQRESSEWCLLYRMAGGHQKLNAYLDSSESSLNLWVLINRGDYEKTAAVLDAVSAFDWRLPGGERPSVRLAGDAYLGYLLVHSIASGQRRSALAALASTFIAVLWMVRSIPVAVMIVLPVVLSVLCSFGLMGWIGLPLGVATSTFCAIALGIGDDFAMHWVARLRLGLERGLPWIDAIRFTSASTGGAILLQGYIVLAGFSVLLFSKAPPNRVLSLVLCMNLLACLAASLVLLPAVATLLRQRLEQTRPLQPELGVEELSA